MKNLLVRMSLVALAMFAGAMSGVAQSTLIHYWNFNTLTTFNNPGIPPIGADYTLMDTSVAKILYVLEPGTSPTYAGYIDNVTSADTLNVRLSSGPGLAMRVRNPTDSMELRFLIPTKGYKNIVVKYVLESSSMTSGQLVELFDYSVDGGATWKDHNAGLTVNGDNIDTLDVTQIQYQNTSWGLVMITFGNDVSVNNNPNLILRVKFSGNTSLVKGNNRFDDVTIEGTAIASDVAESIPTSSAVSLFPNPVVGANENWVVVTSPQELKSIYVYNALGQVMSATTTASAQTPIAVTQFPRGIYLVRVENIHGANIGEGRFVKF